MIAAIIQARLGSTRLPKKVLLPLGKSTILGEVINRLRRCKKLDDIIIATPNPELASNCKVYIGSEYDVLQRYYNAATKFDVDTIVRITSDCPFVDPIEVDRIVEVHFQDKAEYTYNRCDGENSGWADGFDVEVFSYYALEQAYEQATNNYDTEHVTPWMQRHSKATQVVAPLVPLEGMFSINTKLEYDRLKKLYESLPENFTSKDI